MQTRIVATLAAVIAMSSWGVAADGTAPPGATVEVQGLRIVKPAPGGNDNLCLQLVPRHHGGFARHCATGRNHRARHGLEQGDVAGG